MEWNQADRRQMSSNGFSNDVMAGSSLATFSMPGSQEMVVELDLAPLRRATSGELKRLVMNRAIAVIGRGLAVGVALAVFASTLFADLVFGSATLGLGAGVAAVLLLVAVALLASYSAARRAALVDPSKCLKSR